jgi:uncharacterized repeat protein (TIGR01451 family)
MTFLNTFRSAFLALALLLAAAIPAHAACTTAGACITAGPRLASVDTTKSALLNPLLGSLLGTQLSLTAVDWNSLATGNVKALDFLNALQASTNVSTPSQALNANVTLAQVAAALGVAAQAQANTSLSGVLQTLASQLNGVGATVRVGDLVKLTAGAPTLGTTTLNALDMLTGLVQLYNTKNVVSTPQPVGISGGLLGQLGIINSLQLYSQVVEPPVYVCGPAGSQFHSAAIRVKLKLDLVSLAPATTLLTNLGLTTEIAIGKLDVYLELARGEGSLTSVDAVSRAVTLQVTPGVADAYIGTIPDEVFFNRTRSITAADVEYGTVGAITLAGIGTAIQVKSIVKGQAPMGSSVTLSGTFPQTRTVSSSTTFITNIADTLVSNLQVRTATPVGGILADTVAGLLKTIVVGAVTPIVNPILTGVADPLLKLLGVGIGQTVVTVEGICQACDDFKLSKAVDKAAASPGTTLTYTISYQNTGSTTLSNLTIADTTPPFTTYAASACGTLASGLSTCKVAAAPAAGAGGQIQWQFTGTLAPGATGTVTVSVQIQ